LSASAVKSPIPARSEYSIPRSVDWLQLEKANVCNAVLVLPDTLGSVRFEREKLDDDLACLAKLIEKGNVVIVTSPDDVFLHATRETRLLRWMHEIAGQPFSLEMRAYRDRDKDRILENIVNYAHDELGTISDEQHEWAVALLETSERDGGQAAKASVARNRKQFQHLRDTWLPIDFERFVFESLPNATSQNDIFDLLCLGSDMDKRVHSWFVALDGSTRCFARTLRLFAGLGAEEIWKRYKGIVAELRRLDATLSILPLGILRHHAAAYITEEGPIDFTNPRVYRAVAHQVSQNCREYFIELIPLFE